VDEERVCPLAVSLYLSPSMSPPANAFCYLQHTHTHTHREGTLLLFTSPKRKMFRRNNKPASFCLRHAIGCFPGKKMNRRDAAGYLPVFWGVIERIGRLKPTSDGARCVFATVAFDSRLQANKEQTGEFSSSFFFLNE